MKNTSTTAAEKIINEALAIEREAAVDAGALGFMARTLIQATLPHRKVDGPVFERTNGNLTLSMHTSPKIGLPYGSIPRLILAYVTREAVRTQCPTIELGESMAAFMRELDLKPTGGKKGDITRLKDQTRRLFACTVTAIHADKREKIINRTIADETDLWWNPLDPEQTPEWKARVILNQRFFDEVVTDPVPVDMRALKALKQSPLALDTYCWLTHRVSYLMKPTTIPWAALALQFGSAYARARDFKAAFLAELHKVQQVYPAARVEVSDAGLTIKPSPPHIPRRAQT